MIRSAIIVVLTLVALTTGITSIVVATGYTWGGSWGDVVAGSHQTFLTVGGGRYWLSLHRIYRQQEETTRQRWMSDLPGVVLATSGGWRSQRTGLYCERYSIHVSSPVLALVAVLAALYPLRTFLRGPFRRRRRLRKGLCLECAYDLTGNISGVCPECGAEIEAS